MGSLQVVGQDPMPESLAWYHYIWIPHRTGANYGEAQGDNANYGTLLLFHLSSPTIAAKWYSVLLNNGNIHGPYAHS